MPPRLSGAAFLAGAALAVVTSGGIVEERLSAGSPRVGVVVNALVTFGSILTLGLLHRRAPLVAGVIVPQAVGAVLGVLGIHLALRCGWIAGAPWLAERPAQLVNDAVAVFATLTIVWACANRCDLRLLVVALAVLSAVPGDRQAVAPGRGAATGSRHRAGPRHRAARLRRPRPAALPVDDAR